MSSKILSMTLLGLHAHLVEIEIDTFSGLPHFSVVGLPDSAIQEARERVKSAIKNSGFSFPSHKVSLNLAPADLRKTGSRFDLPMALGILEKTQEICIPEKFKKALFLGELSFDGSIRGVSGVLPTVTQAKIQGFKSIFVAKENQEEASVVSGIDVYGVESIRSLDDFFRGSKKIIPKKTNIRDIQKDIFVINESDFQFIKGNEQAKRALEIAAAGGHNVLMEGPPGSGKSLLAKGFLTILPTMNESEILSVSKIHSLAGLTNDRHPLVFERPFRPVHHTASGVSIVGGGNPPRPGEISLAHCGVLFLDELPEFDKKTIEVLRQPLEDGKITISRASGSVEFPSRIMLIATMNPTPCGYPLDHHKCTNAPFEVQRYRNKISGPILDRIDIHLQVPHIPFEKLQSLKNGESSESVRQRVELARKIQETRFLESPIQTNAEMGQRFIKKFCKIDQEGDLLLKSAVERLGLSGRSYFRVIKIARTIADLGKKENIKPQHIAESLQFREDT